MSSISSNPGADAALKTLLSINAGMAEAQLELATGKRVHSADDNAAVWAISKVMEQDVAGFKRVSDSLNLGLATLSVGRQGAETITALLTDIKGKVVAAQEENVDRSKIQDSIQALVDQINAVVETAQFNGQNLLSNRSTEARSGTVNILSSIDRTPTSVSESNITISKADLSTAELSIAAAGGSYDGSVATGTVGAVRSAEIDASGMTVNTGDAFSISFYGTDGNDSTFVEDDYRNTSGSNQSRAEMATNTISYVAREGDGAADVIRALAAKFSSETVADGLDPSVLSMSASGDTLTVKSEVTTATDSIAVHINRLDADAGSTIGGGLDGLSRLDVTTQDGAEGALVSIESMLEYAIGVASDMGSGQRRLETQDDFISGLTDALKSGIGTLVDADLEEASARLQALQVQQQLAVQAMSIANGAPQVLLGLFR